MAKWADYLISAVRFNAAGTHIDKVKAHVDQDDSVGSPVVMDRQTVIARINSGTTFATIFDNGNGGWKLGAHVKVVPIYGVDYIKTYADGTTRDNLDNLPTF
jgi:hypothetical protein